MKSELVLKTVVASMLLASLGLPAVSVQAQEQPAEPAVQAGAGLEFRADGIIRIDAEYKVGDFDRVGGQFAGWLATRPRFGLSFDGASSEAVGDVARNLSQLRENQSFTVDKVSFRDTQIDPSIAIILKGAKFLGRHTTFDFRDGGLNAFWKFGEAGVSMRNLTLADSKATADDYWHLPELLSRYGGAHGYDRLNIGFYTSDQAKAWDRGAAGVKPPIRVEDLEYTSGNALDAAGYAGAFASMPFQVSDRFYLNPGPGTFTVSPPLASAMAKGIVDSDAKVVTGLGELNWTPETAGVFIQAFADQAKAHPGSLPTMYLDERLVMATNKLSAHDQELLARSFGAGTTVDFTPRTEDVVTQLTRWSPDLVAMPTSDLREEAVDMANKGRFAAVAAPGGDPHDFHNCKKGLYCATASVPTASGPMAITGSPEVVHSAMLLHTQWTQESERDPAEQVVTTPEPIPPTAVQ